MYLHYPSFVKRILKCVTSHIAIAIFLYEWFLKGVYMLQELSILIVSHVSMIWHKVYGTLICFKETWVHYTSMPKVCEFFSTIHMFHMF